MAFLIIFYRIILNELFIKHYPKYFSQEKKAGNPNNIPEDTTNFSYFLLL